MIQVYEQKTVREVFPEDKWFIADDTFWGIHFTIEKYMPEGVVVTLNGTSSVDSETYINFTWPIQPNEIGDYIHMEVSRESDSTLYFGISYVQAGISRDIYFADGEKEHDFYLPNGIADIRAVAYVRGHKSVNTSIIVKLWTCREPPSTEMEYMDQNGDMTLFPTEAMIHAALNGTWQAVLEHPIDDDGRWKYLQEEAVVKMPSFFGENDQLFRIKKKKKSDSGVSCTMEPIFYDSIGDCFLEDIRPTKKNGQQALDLMLAPNSKYSGSSDITRTATAYYQFKNFMEALNGDDENSFINRWGGEILFNNFEVIVNDRVGGDYGVELRYGKNIKKDGLTEEVDTRDIVTRIYPKAYNGYTMTDDGHVDSPLINSYPTIKTATITFDDVKMVEDAQEDDEDSGVIVCNTQAELDAALKQRCQEQFDAGIDKPKINIAADMILLANTELYRDYQVLETVSLGDTIHCRHSRLEIITDARVIELEYDSIHKRVSSVVLGDFQYDYFDNVSSAVNRIDGAIRPDGSLMAEKISGFINGAMASLRAQYNVAKKQDVLAILFENLDKESPSYGAMAMGTKGLMISNTRTVDGRDWDWTTALTANGLIAGIIVAGILSDQTGKSWWNLDTGIIHLESGYFSGEVHAKSGTFTGQINSGSGNIAGWEIVQTYLKSEQENNRVFLASYGYNQTSAIVVQEQHTGNWRPTMQVLYDGEIRSYMYDPVEETLCISGGKITGTNSRAIDLSAHAMDGTEEFGDGTHHTLGMTYIYGGLQVRSGEKSIVVDTKDYGEQSYYCYELPTPMLGDLGSGVIGEDGSCVISIDDIFQESNNMEVEYYIQLQKKDQGDLWVTEQTPGYFVVHGTPGIEFFWEIKAKQTGKETVRFTDPSLHPEVDILPTDYENMWITYRDRDIEEKEMF